MVKSSKLFKSALLISTVLFSITACTSTKAESSNLENTEIVKPEITLASNFKKEIENMKITLESAPAAPIVGNSFAKPFVVSVKDLNGNPYSNYTLTVSRPAGKSDGKIQYVSEEVVTDDAGIVSYKLEPYSTTINGTITFMPKAPNNNSSNLKLAQSKALIIPCRVKISLPKGKSIMVAVVDYNENDKMILSTGVSSSNLVSEFWKAGYPYQASNADFHKQIDLGSEAVYKAAKAMVGGANIYKYIVFGKVKYASEITQSDAGFTLSLKGTVTAIDWATGTEICTIEKTTTVTESNKWAVYKACQAQLAKELAEDLVYSM